MNCCIITRMIKFACMALLFVACCPAKGEVCELLGFQPYLQQKGIFAGPVWSDNGHFLYAQSSNRIEIGESRIRLRNVDNLECDFEHSFVLHEYTKQTEYTNLNLFAEATITQSLTKCRISCKSAVCDWQLRKFGIPVPESLLRANLSDARLVETYLKPVIIRKMNCPVWAWISVNVFRVKEKSHEGYASISLRRCDGKNSPLCVVAFNESDGCALVAHKFVVDIAIHPYIDISNKVMMYVSMDGLESVVELCDCSERGLVHSVE